MVLVDNYLDLSDNGNGHMEDCFPSDPCDPYDPFDDPCEMDVHTYLVDVDVYHLDIVENILDLQDNDGFVIAHDVVVIVDALEIAYNDAAVDVKVAVVDIVDDVNDVECVENIVNGAVDAEAVAVGIDAVDYVVGNDVAAAFAFVVEEDHGHDVHLDLKADNFEVLKD